MESVSPSCQPTPNSQARSISPGSPAAKRRSRAFILGGGEVAEETPDVVLDAKRDFRRKPFPKLRHGQVDEHVFGARIAGHLPELLAITRDDQGERPFDSASRLS